MSASRDADKNLEAQDNFNRLCEDYEPLLCSMTESYAVIGGLSPAERDDLRQEATLALYLASLAYKGAGGVTFGLYAKICIGNALVSYLRRSKRVKNTVSIESGASEELADDAGDPIESLIRGEDAAHILEVAKRELSSYERKVFELYVLGMSPKEIAHELGKTEKSASNAVFRIKTKIKANF